MIRSVAEGTTLRTAVSGGGSGPLLLLLHGMGTTAEVWLPLIDQLRDDWPGRWLAPDLPGHGGSAWQPGYSLGAHAAAVVSVVNSNDPVYILGHSMGAAIAITLASGWFGLRVASVGALGMKLSWTDDEINRSRDRAARPVKWCDSEEEATALYLKVSGLTGTIANSDPIARAGITLDRGRYRLAADPKTFSVATGQSTLISAATAPIAYGAGDHDMFVTPAELRALRHDAWICEDTAHNVHVERPSETWAWAREILLKFLK